LATTEYSKVPPTIRSRCQKYEFHRATTNELVSRLTYVAESEGFEFEPAALGAIARMADGAYRDALTLLEQAALSTSEGGITLAHVYDQLGLIQDDAADAILISLKEGDFQTLSEKFNEILRLGRDPRSIVEGLLFRASELTRALHMVGEDVDASIAAAAHATAVRIGSDELLTIRALLADTHRTINNVTLPRIWLEAELIRVSKAVQSAKAGAAQTPIVASTKREEPVAKAPAEKPVQRAVEPAKPPVQQEKPQTPPAEKAVVEVPEGNSIQAKWARVLAAGSKAFQAKLADVEVELQGNMLTLFFPGRLSHDWVSEDPRKVQYIREKVAGEFGKDVEIVLAIRKPQISDAPAVELELQGQALYEEAKKLTQGNNE
jgi:DNA polymerase-3 subunit gamma/tau